VLLTKWVRKGGVQGWVHHTQIDGALGLFVNRMGGRWVQNNGGWALLTKQVRKGGCKDGSAPYTNRWCTGPVCEPSRWALDTKRWGLGAIDKSGEKGGWECGIHKLMVHWALFASRAGGCWV